MITTTRIINSILILVIATGVFKLVVAKLEVRESLQQAEAFKAKFGIDGDRESDVIKIRSIETGDRRIQAWRALEPARVKLWMRTRTPMTSSVSPLSGSATFRAKDFGETSFDHGTIFTHQYLFGHRSGSETLTNRIAIDSVRHASMIEDRDQRDFLKTHWDEFEVIPYIGNETKTFGLSKSFKLLEIVVPAGLRPKFESEFPELADRLRQKNWVLIQLSCGQVKVLHADKIRESESESETESSS